ncbi:MAG: hypothetical protein ABI877_18795 [Gemmatimonadaceae bacterium]
MGDTVGAEARLSEIERNFNDSRFRFIASMSFYRGFWLGRAWLLSGEVAAARGRRDEASRMYRRVIGLLGGGDADLAPDVDRARTKLASLSTR